MNSWAARLAEQNRVALESKLGTHLAHSWFDAGSVDYWRHQRMYETVSPIVHSRPGSRWVTVGDGRFGLDSIKLRRLNPTLEVLPTDVVPALLEQAKADGLISDYRIADAAALPFEDESFDFAFCKESYHHLPRPALALYEMIRVAREAVLLIEPHDGQPLPPVARLLDRLKAPVRRFLGRRSYPRDYWNYEESTGNYIYAISQREIEKVCLGLNLPCAAFFTFNDYYESGLELEQLGPRSRAYKRVRHAIRMADLRCRLGLSLPGMMTAVLFKVAPAAATRQLLERLGHHIVDFPRNPHVKRSPHF